MCKGTNFISEIGKYFKENNALNAINNITSMMENVTFSESVLFWKEKQMQLQVHAAAGASVAADVPMLYD